MKTRTIHSQPEPEEREEKFMAKQEVRRASFVIVFGDGDQRWSMPDPSHPVVDEANHRTRYGTPTKSDGLVLADTVSALAYLIHTCPTTKLACEKLAAMRAAVRKLGPVAGEVTCARDEAGIVKTCSEIVGDAPCGKPATCFNAESHVLFCDEHGGQNPRLRSNGNARGVPVSSHDGPEGIDHDALDVRLHCGYI